VSAPIFVIGTERSGTNLLRLMLDSHSTIAVPHPPHIVKFLKPLERYYGDLAIDANFRRLVADACRLVELHTYPWGFRPDRAEVVTRARGRDLLAVYLQLYDQYLAHSGKQRWACKSTFMIDNVVELLAYRPDSRFVFMVRDPRDVAVSAKGSIFNHFHVFYSARRWQREQRIGLDRLRTLAPEQIMLLKYEELITAPEEILRHLCAFLDEPFEPQMLEYHRSREAQTSGSLSVSWHNTSRPVLRENRQKYRHSLTEREIRQIEAICGAEMRELGYVPEFPANTAYGDLTRERFSYRVSEGLLKARVEATHLLRDKNSAARIRKTLFIRAIGALRRLASHHA
jgi:hypothetical protein